VGIPEVGKVLICVLGRYIKKLEIKVPLENRPQPLQAVKFCLRLNQPLLAVVRRGEKEEWQLF
jgi:hypothetical protein